MRASATILAQRYLEGDMTEHERAAFIEDLAHNPDLQEILEREMQLDVAIINDAFSIEPPTAMRQAVLDAISSHPHRYARGFAGFNLTGRIVMMLLCIVGSAVGTRYASLHNAVHETRKQSNQGVLEVAALRQPSPPVHRASVPAQPLNEESPIEAQSNASPIEQEVTTINLLPPAIPPRLGALYYSSAMQPMEHQPSTSSSLVSATLGSGVGSFRYNIAAPGQLNIFVEGGLLGMNRFGVSYINQIRTIAFQNTTVAYAALGIAGALTDLPVGERSLMGSFAIGATAAGPMVMADLSTSLFDIGPTTIDAGVRIVGISDLRNAGAVSLQTLPFVRLSLGF
jgi:hypothetical protein